MNVVLAALSEPGDKTIVPKPAASNLKLRILSALVLVPLVLAIIYQGGPIFYIFLGVLFVLSLHEWQQLAARTLHRQIFLVFGGLYLTLSFFALLEIQKNIEMAFLFVFMVWASDTGAYVFGKFIGGPKMAGKLSPNKTWAGLAGAALVPYAIFLIWAWVILPHQKEALFVLGAGFITSCFFGLACQGGDLLVSYLKRQAGAKDTGMLIPGHGGVLDRIDSLLMGGLFMYILSHVT